MGQGRKCTRGAQNIVYHIARKQRLRHVTRTQESTWRGSCYPRGGQFEHQYKGIQVRKEKMNHLYLQMTWSTQEIPRNLQSNNNNNTHWTNKFSKGFRIQDTHTHKKKTPVFFSSIKQHRFLFNELIKTVYTYGVQHDIWVPCEMVKSS